MTCCRTVREELRSRHLAPTVQHIHHVCRSQWKIPTSLFIGYRLVVTCYVFAWNACNYVTAPWIGHHFCLVFITGWAYLLLAVYFAMATITTIIYACHERYSEEGELVNDPCREDLFESEIITNGGDRRENPPHAFIGSNTDTCDGCETTHVNGNDGTGHVCSTSSPAAPNNTLTHNVSTEIPLYINNSSSDKATESICEIIPLSQDIIADTPGKLSPQTHPDVTSREITSSSHPVSLLLTSRLTLLLFSIVSSSSIVVSTAYFAIVLPIILSYNGNYRPTPIDVNVHAVNSIILFVEIFISQIRIRLLHVIYPVLFGTTYVVFTVAYWRIDPEENRLYWVMLDWTNPKFSVPISLGFLFIIIPVFHIFVFLLIQIRITIHRSIIKRYPSCS